MAPGSTDPAGSAIGRPTQERQKMLCMHRSKISKLTSLLYVRHNTTYLVCAQHGLFLLKSSFCPQSLIHHDKRKNAANEGVREQLARFTAILMWHSQRHLRLVHLYYTDLAGSRAFCTLFQTM